MHCPDNTVVILECCNQWISRYQDTVSKTKPAWGKIIYFPLSKRPWDLAHIAHFNKLFGLCIHFFLF